MFFAACSVGNCNNIGFSSNMVRVLNVFIKTAYFALVAVTAVRPELMY